MKIFYKLVFLLFFLHRLSPKIIQELTNIAGSYNEIFHVGEPGQTVSIKLSLTNEYTFLSPFIFRKNYSESYRFQKTLEIAPDITGEEALDCFTFYSEPKLTINSYKFIYIIKKRTDYMDSFSLAYQLKDNDTSYSFIHALKKAGYIDKPSFTLINKPFNTVEIEYGGISHVDPSKKYSHKCVVNPEIKKWGCELTKMFYYNNDVTSSPEIELKLEKNQNIIFETSFNKINAPKKIMSLLRETFLKPYIEEKICKYHEIQDFDFFTCSCKRREELRTLYLVFQDKILIKINNTHLVEEYMDICFFIIQYSKMMSDSNDTWYAGTNFLNLFDMSFDYEEGSVTFFNAQPFDYSVNTPINYYTNYIQNISIIITIILLGVGLSLLLVIRYKCI